MPAEKPVLAFLTNEGDEEEGLGHAGIETYRDAPVASVGRECGQNSADARVAAPVAMEFDVFDIPADDYPCRSDHLAAIDACLARARQVTDKKAIDFFARAQSMLTAPTIRVLRISDSNTKGLVGPAEGGTPFNSLLKGAGVSSKERDTSGGSFGIGKNAAFAASDLQTVFYSTIYRDVKTGTQQFLAQGKTILVSHTDRGGTKRRATGYWGLPRFQPINTAAQVPEWMRREAVGTSVFVIGFRETSDWKFRVAASLTQNFFGAIHRGEIEFHIGPDLILDRGSVRQSFERRELIQAAEDGDQLEDFDFSRQLFTCLTDPDSVQTTVNIASLGSMRIQVLVRDKFAKRIAIVRNGMFITDNLGHFGDKFAKFPWYKDFVALVEPVDDSASALIKQLENPRHDDLSAERLTDPLKRRDATRAIKRLAKEIRDAIKAQALTAPASEVAIDELTEFFAGEGQTDQPPVPGPDDNPETYTYQPVPRRRPPGVADAADGNGQQGGAKSGTGRGSSGRGGRGGGSGGGSGGRGSKGGQRTIDLDEVRNVLSSADSGWHRQIYFTPSESGTASLTVFASGIESSEQLSVLRSDTGQVNAGRIVVELETGKRKSVRLTFREVYGGPIELTATAAGGTDA